MSIICISVQISMPSAAVLGDLRRITGLGLLDLCTRLQQGQPLFEQDIFAGQPEAVFAQIRALLDALQRHACEPDITESGDAVSAQILRNLLQSSEEQAEETRRLDDLGHC